MLEIIGLILLCNVNKKNALKAGKSGGSAIGMTIGLWIGLELAGAFIGGAAGLGMGSYLLALVLAIIGGVISYNVAKKPSANAPYVQQAYVQQPYVQQPAGGTMFCPGCGNQMAAGMAFCPLCGQCGYTWVDGVGYRAKTIVRCPECGLYNLADTEHIRYNFM